jgi:SpoVK/Ycf46/Vps4 family AAA+-type ATPase
MIQHKQNPAKAFLMRYRALEQKCAALERAIRSAMENATNTTVALKEICVQTSGGGEMMANAVVSAIDATKVLEEQRQEASKTMREIMEAIKAVPDDTQQTVLIEKYVNGLTLQQIQSEIHYEKRNTIIIHGRALLEVWQWMKRKGLCDG